MLALPELEVDALTSSVSDHLTFYVAVSPHIGTPDIQAVGDSTTFPEPVIGDWSSPETGVSIGWDCIHPQVELTALDMAAELAQYETGFLPPTERCLEMPATRGRVDRRVSPSVYPTSGAAGSCVPGAGPSPPR
jgi:hypothetical protein